MTEFEKIKTCWFCKKTQREVEVLIAGTEDICICSECVEICNDIIKKYREAKQAHGGAKDIPKKDL